MATTTSITTTYAGEFANKYIAAALLSGKTLNDQAISLRTNIKYQEKIKKLAVSDIIKNATCDFTDTGSVTLTERIISPEEFQINVELCKKDFRSDWEAQSMGMSVHDSLPKSFADYFVAYVAAGVAQKTEQNIWGGVNSNAGEFDGFTVLMAADSDVVDAANGSQTAFTSSNIQTLFGNVLSDVPSAVYGAEDLTLYVPTVAYQQYIRSLNGFGASGLGAAGINAQGSMWYNNGNALSFEGVKVQLAPGMPADHIVAAQASNLYFGTGLLQDHVEVKVIDMADIDGSQNVRIVMRFTAGVQYGIGSEVVLLTLASA